MPEESTKISCPNCSAIAIKEGNKIICEACDAEFTFTKTGGARVKKIGRLDSLEDRMDRIESLLPEPDLEPPEPEPNPEDHPILGEE